MKVPFIAPSFVYLHSFVKGSYLLARALYADHNSYLASQKYYLRIPCFVDYSLRRYLRSNEGAFVAVSVDYHFPPWMEHVADSLSTVLRRRKERR